MRISTINFFKKYWPSVLVILLTFWAIQGLLHPGYFPMHDDEHIARLYDFNLALKTGQFPPRWMQHLGFGYGFPLFIFYPPVIYYIAELFYGAGVSIILSTKVMMGLGFILAALFMYAWIKNRFGRLSGIFAALLYTYAPYHAVDLYVRGAVAEFFSFVWIPALFWMIDLISSTKRMKYVYVGGIFFALIILTHNLVALSFIPFLCIYALGVLFSNKYDKKKILVLYLIAAFLGVGLSAFFWMPALLEKQYTIVDDILTKQLASYKIHFVYLQQFWNSPWGYGGSVAGPIDGLSFQVGKIQIVVSVLALYLTGGLLILRRKVTKEVLYVGLLVVSLVMSLYMASFYSEWIWDGIQPLWYIQFPWRFLLFSALFSSALGGYVISVANRYLPKIVVIIIVVILSGLALYTVRSYFQPSAYIPATDAQYTSREEMEWRVSSMSFEYVPKGITTVLSPQGTTQLPITKSDIAISPFVIVSGKATGKIIKNDPVDKRFIVKSSTPTQFRVNTFSFPGWHITVDGHAQSYSDTNKLKLITFPLEPGRHTVEATYTKTWDQYVANTLTLVSIFSLILGIIYSRMKGKIKLRHAQKTNR